MFVLEKGDAVKACDIDKGLKNKFRWDWLDKTITLSLKGGVPVSVVLSECIRKIDLPGKAKCLFCNDIIDYGGRGCSTIIRHMNSSKHLKIVDLRKNNYELKSTFLAFSSQPSTSSNTQTQPVVPISSRVLTAQATVLGFMAEHNLPFTLSPHLIQLSKELSRDNKALSALSMDSTSASIKMKYGLADTLLDETVTKLQNSHFSFNIDEATSNNSLRVLTILVSYFSEDLNRVIIEHVSSISLFSVNSQNIFNAIDSLMSEKNIPYQNLMSIMMDSCAVMRGSKSGFETRVRQEKAPHLLDIDGDSCHHIHNATKKFCRSFEYFIEGLFTDLNNDFRWSADLKQYLSQICQCLNIRFSAPQRYLSHRWLSCYEVAIETQRMWDALTIYYYASLKSDDSVTYLSVVLSIYKKKELLSNPEDVKKIQKALKNIKPSTNEGKERRLRIINKLFYCRKKTLLILQVYTAVLPILKKYVALFQTTEPMIHVLYNEQKKVFKTFMSCFIKPEILKGLTGDDLLTKNFITEKNILKDKELFVGASALFTVSKCNKTIMAEFYQQLKSAYIACGTYLQKKLSLNNPFLINVSGINPSSIGETTTLKRLEKLPSIATNVLNHEELTSYMLEIRRFQFYDLPSPFSSDHKPLNLDEWWSKIFTMEEFPTLSKLVKALISCFHGPVVEGTFSTMNHIIDPRSGRLDIKTYSAIQTAKTSLKSKKTSAIKYFHREDFLRDNVNLKLLKNMRSSYKRYREEKGIMEPPKKKQKIQTKTDGQTLIKEAETYALQKFQKQRRNKLRKKNDHAKKKIKNNCLHHTYTQPEPVTKVTNISETKKNQKESWKNFFQAVSKKK